MGAQGPAVRTAPPGLPPSPRLLLLAFAPLLLLAPPSAAAVLPVDPAAEPVPAGLLGPNSSPALRGAETILGCRPRDAAGALLRSCPACAFHDEAEALRLFIRERRDGVGTRIKDIITGMAVAAYNGMNFGGVLVDPATCQSPHGVDVLRTAEVVFGLPSARSLFSPHFITAASHRFLRSFWSIRDLEKWVARGQLPKAGGKVFLRSFCVNCELGNHTVAESEYFNPKFLAALRSQGGLAAAKGGPPGGLNTTRRAGGKPVVAFHVRRGDIRSTQNNRRGYWTEDQYYYDLLAYIRGLVPTAEFHVVSSTRGSHNRSEYNASDFDGYRGLGAAVHLDEDVIEDWSRFASANVFVMAKRSTFSFVPALFNPNCIISQPSTSHEPLPQWIRASGETGGPLLDEQAFVACLRDHGLLKDQN